MWEPHEQDPEFQFHPRIMPLSDMVQFALYEDHSCFQQDSVHWRRAVQETGHQSVSDCNGVD